MSFPMIEDETLDPSDIGLFGPVAVMKRLDSLSYLI